MRKGLLGTVATLLAGAGVALGQTSSSVPKAKPGLASVSSENTVIQAEGVLPSPPLPIIPPPVGGVGQGGGEGGFPYPNAPTYPPPMNFDPYGQDPGAALAGSSDPAREVPKIWSHLDFLLWFVKSQPVSYPLLTTGSPASQGILNTGTVATLIGTSDLSYNIQTGFRADFGFWCEPSRRVGFELGGFSLARSTNRTIIQGDPFGNPVLARPFVNSLNGNQSSIVISSPAVAGGSVVFSTSNQLFGGEGNMFLNLFRTSPDAAVGYSATAILGVRYVDLQEKLDVYSRSTIIDPTTISSAFGVVNGPPGTTYLMDIRDSVRTFNQFYGGQIGLDQELRVGRFVFGSKFKLAGGNMHQFVKIEGETSLTRNIPAVTARQTFFGPLITTPASSTRSSVLGGLYGNASNIGKDRNDEFTVIPEINLNIGYQLTPHMLGEIGYNFLYIDKVARPGNINLSTINPGLIPASTQYGQTAGAPVRTDLFRQSDFYAQGATIRLILTY